MELIEWS